MTDSFYDNIKILGTNDDEFIKQELSRDTRNLIVQDIVFVTDDILDKKEALAQALTRCLLTPFRNNELSNTLGGDYEDYGSVLFSFNGSNFNNIGVRNEVKKEIQRVFNYILEGSIGVDNVSLSDVKYNINGEKVELNIIINFNNEVFDFWIDVFNTEVV